MKHAWMILVALGWFAGGCGNVVGPEEFLYTYRTGAMSGAPVSPGGAVYAGKDGEFHVIKLRSGSGTPSDRFLNVSDRDQRTLRCRVDQLPADFPKGFQQLGMDQFESSEETRNFVQMYLVDSAEKPARPTPKPIADRDWNDPG